jgi:hypothetical protein
VPADKIFAVSKLTGLRLSDLRPDLVKKGEKLHV